MKRISLRQRLVWTLVTAFVGVGAVTATIGYREAHRSVDKVLDAHLVQTGRLITAEATHELDEMDPAELRELASWSQRLTVQVWDAEGRTLYRSRDAPSFDSMPPDESLADRTAGGRLWRVFVSRDRITGARVAVAEDHAPREALARRIALDAVLPMLVALPVIAVLVGWIVRRGLQPIAAVAAEIERRGPQTLDPLGSDDLPPEIVPMVVRLDELLARVRASLEQERHFASNAAHELRNPLAALRAQAELARDSRDRGEVRAALDAVIEACDRLTRLVEQLLALARVEEVGSVVTSVRLDRLARDVVADLAPPTLAAGRELAFEAATEVSVQGNATLLDALLRNLVDNALRHGGESGAVTVRVATAEGRAIVAVEDEGTGLPPEAIERLGQRFERLAAPADTGTGLGLALVARIARWHGGELRFESAAERVGTRAVVELPLH